jgi:hypothetical protein
MSDLFSLSFNKFNPRVFKASTTNVLPIFMTSSQQYSLNQIQNLHSQIVKFELIALQREIILRHQYPHLKYELSTRF